jgi:hypothetical protein
MYHTYQKIINNELLELEEYISFINEFNNVFDMYFKNIYKLSKIIHIYNDNKNLHRIDRSVIFRFLNYATDLKHTNKKSIINKTLLPISEIFNKKNITYNTKYIFNIYYDSLILDTENNYFKQFKDNDLLDMFTLIDEKLIKLIKELIKFNGMNNNILYRETKSNILKLARIKQDTTNQELFIMIQKEYLKRKIKNDNTTTKNRFKI